ncbi:MAG TPA: endonuclease III [Candidatus Omnitrophota bacterium]|nr:endonuclease III [Candidatus Omnitrophota bacterium]
MHIARTRIVTIIAKIKQQVKCFTIPSVTVVSDRNDPYLVLISCLLSLRTKDTTTVDACNRLFPEASTPQAMLKLSAPRIARLIYPVGFYNTKAKTIRDVSARIINDFQGKVPRTLEGLLSLKGVGLKTANLVLGLGFQIPAICVDTHVHRIPNRLGWIKTKTPEESEKALKKIVPKRLWIDLNTILVTFGQNLCLPVSPWCSTCVVSKLCPRIGVNRCR